MGAPFGRIGAALGFRWIMPIGTVPLPFHPWLARLLPWAIVALVGWRLISLAAGENGGVGWRTLFVAAGLIAVPMAIPIVQWFARAFRVPLLQALLIGGGMVLIAADAAAGALPAWAGAVPAAWLGLWLAQRLGGPVYLRRLQAANAAFERIEVGDRLVIIERDSVATGYANHLFREFALAQVAVGRGRPDRANGFKQQTYHRLSPDDRLGIVGRFERLLPTGWQVKEDRIVSPGVAASGGKPPLRLRMRRHRAPFWLIGGRRDMLEIRDGARVHRLVGGKAELTGRWPLFTFFYYVNIFTGSGRAEGRLVAGFVPDKTVELGTTRFWEMAPRAFTPLAEVATPPFADAAPLHVALDTCQAKVGDEAAKLFERLLRLDEKLPYFWPTGADLGALSVGHGPALCDCLAAAKEAKYEQAVRLAAELIAALPPDEYRALADRLIILLNSKEMAFRILKEGVDPKSSAAIRTKNILGGFNLVGNVPRLFERLGELGETARPLVMAMGGLGDWPGPLIKARETLDAR